MNSILLGKDRSKANDNNGELHIDTTLAIPKTISVDPTLLRQQPRRRGRLTGSDTVPLSQRSNRQLSSTSYNHTHHDNNNNSMPRSKGGRGNARARSLPDVLDFEELMAETSSAVEKRQIKVDENDYNKMQRSRSADDILDFVLADEFAEDALEREKLKKWQPNEKRKSSAAPPSRTMAQKQGSKQRILVPMDYTLDSSQRPPGVNNISTYSHRSMEQACVLKMARQNSLLEVEPRRSRSSLHSKMRSLPDVLNFEEVKKEQTQQPIQQEQHVQKMAQRRFRSKSADIISEYGRWDDDMIDLEENDKNPHQTHQRRNKSFRKSSSISRQIRVPSSSSKQAVNDILPIVQNTGSSKHIVDMSRSGGSRRSDAATVTSLPDVLDLEEMMRDELWPKKQQQQTEMKQSDAQHPIQQQKQTQMKQSTAQQHLRRSRSADTMIEYLTEQATNQHKRKAQLKKAHAFANMTHQQSVKVTGKSRRNRNTVRSPPDLSDFAESIHDKERQHPKQQTTQQAKKQLPADMFKNSRQAVHSRQKAPHTRPQLRTSRPSSMSFPDILDDKIQPQQYQRLKVSYQPRRRTPSRRREECIITSFDQVAPGLKQQQQQIQRSTSRGDGSHKRQEEQLLMEWPTTGNQYKDVHYPPTILPEHTRAGSSGSLDLLAIVSTSLPSPPQSQTLQIGIQRSRSKNMLVDICKTFSSMNKKKKQVRFSGEQSLYVYEYSETPREDLYYTRHDDVAASDAVVTRARAIRKYIKTSMIQDPSYNDLTGLPSPQVLIKYFMEPEDIIGIEHLLCGKGIARASQKLKESHTKVLLNEQQMGKSIDLNELSVKMGKYSSISARLAVCRASYAALF